VKYITDKFQTIFYWYKSKDRLYLNREAEEIEPTNKDNDVREKMNVSIYERRMELIKKSVAKYKRIYSNEKIEEHYVVDKHGFPVCLLHIKDDESYGTIYFIVDSGYTDRLFYEIYGKEYIYLVDIQGYRTINKGIGTEAIRLLCDIAKKGGIKQIKGFLSPVDEDHVNRQLHFYRKNGFIVENNRLVKTL